MELNFTLRIYRNANEIIICALSESQSIKFLFFLALWGYRMIICNHGHLNLRKKNRKQVISYV